MKKILFVIVALFVAFSVNAKDDYTFDKKLQGTWELENGITVVIDKNTMTMVEDGKTYVLNLRQENNYSYSLRRDYSYDLVYFADAPIKKYDLNYSFNADFFDDGHCYFTFDTCGVFKKVSLKFKAIKK